jgi:hypothetical protein
MAKISTSKTKAETLKASDELLSQLKSKILPSEPLETRHARPPFSGTGA